MALTSRKRLLLALIGLLLLPDHNEARVLSETRVGYDDDSSESVGPSAPPTSRPDQPATGCSSASREGAGAESVILGKNPSTRVAARDSSEPTVAPEPAVVPTPEGSVREDLESGLLQELEQEKKQK